MKIDKKSKSKHLKGTQKKGTQKKGTQKKKPVCDLWELVGTATPTLQNKMKPGGTVVLGVSIQTNLNTRIRVLEDGMVYILPRSGTIFGTSGGQYKSATVQVQGGENSALACVCSHPVDWRQNIQSVVSRKRTVSFVVHWSGKDRFYVHGDGVVYAAGAWFGSDKRFKTDVKPITSALEKVLRLNGVLYRRKPEKGDKTKNPVEIGLIAQDVEKVVPEAVATMHDGTTAVAYANMVALLIESVKEQQTQINSLNDEIRHMRAKK